MLHLHKAKDKTFYFTLVADNGEPLVTSETYNRRAGAVKGMKAVVKILSAASAGVTHPVRSGKKYLDCTGKGAVEVYF